MLMIVVAGPTASGKSALALDVAREFGGEVINADSMQVYRELRILTARPSPADEARAPHRLYGVLPAAEACSVGRWREMATAAAEEAWAAGRLPVLAGGTGLYIKSLIEGISPIPDIPEDIRAEARALLRRLGNAAFYARLAERDPATAARLAPGNTQRLARAWEVLAATGRPLVEWQAEPPVGALDAHVQTLSIEPPREQLFAACDGRFRRMLEQGALAEVAALDALGLDPAQPAMRALGVPELRAHLHGRLELSEAVAAAQKATRHFAKRQLTWFRHQGPRGEMLGEQYSESLRARVFPIIHRFLLTADG